MSDRTYSGLFIAEGSSDQPLAEHIELLFYERGVDVKLSHPAFERPPKVGKDVGSRVENGIKLMDGDADLIVVHRDADNAGHRRQLLSRLDRSGPVCRLDSWNRLVNEIDHVVKYLR
ncbi:hypothetical protein [Micromonospora sp. DPT]|uniref:hypothetical protein n=1 Tax=Micromonospora sp. DPT TaxID=3142975 RepID=UPI00320B2B1B